MLKILTIILTVSLFALGIFFAIEGDTELLIVSFSAAILYIYLIIDELRNQANKWADCS